MARKAQFRADISEWCRKARGRPEIVVRYVSMEMLRRVIMKSPVGNPSLWKNPPPPGYVGGRFRNNWQVAIGGPASGTINEPDASGARALSEGGAVIDGFTLGQILYVVNNLPYAVRLEYGWSTQAPGGMVRTTLQEFNALVDEGVGEAKRQMP